MMMMMTLHLLRKTEGGAQGLNLPGQKAKERTESRRSNSTRSRGAKGSKCLIWLFPPPSLPGIMPNPLLTRRLSESTSIPFITSNCIVNCSLHPS
jgi:hypothetical protein